MTYSDQSIVNTYFSDVKPIIGIIYPNDISNQTINIIIQMNTHDMIKSGNLFLRSCPVLSTTSTYGEFFYNMFNDFFSLEDFFNHLSFKVSEKERTYIQNKYKDNLFLDIMDEYFDPKHDSSINTDYIKNKKYLTTELLSLLD